MPERARSRAKPSATVPQQFAETLPPEVAQNHSFSIQAIFELQRAFGKVERAVESLEKKAEEQSDRLKTIERTIWIATGAFIVISAGIGVAVKYGLDMLSAVVKH